MSESFVDRLVDRQKWLGGVGDVLQKVVGGVYGGLGKPGRALKNLMHGTIPLGHPLHPAVTDVPIGAFVAGVVADYVAHFTTRLPTEAGDLCLAVGLAAAVLAAVTGLTDHHETYGHERDLATAHGLVMVVAVVVDAVSLALRWWAGDSSHALAVVLSTAGLALVLGGGYLGGHLVFGIGTMVNRNAFTEGSHEFVEVGPAADFPEGALRRVDAGGMPALVVRRGGRIWAIGAVCSHAGGPLDEGTLDGTRVTCPWHGSVFCIMNGRVQGGPATFAQPAFDVREEDGRVLLKLSGPAHE